MPIIRLIIGVVVVCAAMDQAEANRIIAERMTVVRGNEFAPAQTDAVLAIDGRMLLEALKPYQNDPEFRLRRASYWIAWVKGRKSADLAVRQEVVGRLLGSCKDAEMAAHTAQRLLDFHEADFSETSKATLRELMQDPDPRHEMLLAVGIAGLRDLEPKLRKFAAEDWRTVNAERPRFRSMGWAATRALARMGDKQAITECVKAVEEFPDVIRRVGLLDELAYIRQPEAVAVLVKYLDTDERLEGPDPGRPSMKIAQYALRNLCRIITDFPVPVGSEIYTDAEIETARKWMKEHKDYTIIR